MTRDQAKQEIRSRVEATRYLTKSKSGLYNCPYCGSGTKKNKTGAVEYYPHTNTFCCHACGKTGDVIDLYQQTTGADFNTALTELAAEAGIKIDGAGGHQRPQERAGAATSIKTTPAATMPKADFMEYYKACIKRMDDPAAVEYLSFRGISRETAARYWIGYDPAADPANAPGATMGDFKPHPCPRLIVPFDNSHYMGRSIDQKTEKRFMKINNRKQGDDDAIPPFNLVGLYNQDRQPVFIVEGAFDALSIIEAGGMAVATNSTGNIRRIIENLKARPTSNTLILCLDTDEAGRKATGELVEGLKWLNASYVTADICGNYKDPNERLTHDRSGFIEAVEAAKQKTTAKPDNVSYYIDALMSADISRFRSEIKTGYANLDQKSGGLYGGLYSIAAISSLGKTTFAAQMADQIAEAGNDVLFFSLEQSRLELVSKSLARITAQDNPETAVTSLSIRKGYLPPQVLAAAEKYKERVSDRISVIEGNFNCNVSFIGEYIRQYIQRTGARPVVFIDYLQILQGEPEQGKQSTKEIVDHTVTELKRISRAHDLPIFIISSVNRANYNTPIDFESLKESGGIEYTCDVIWGLQLQCLNDDIFSGDSKAKIKEKREKIKEAKAATPRKIELVCLKNRYGIANFNCLFDYYPANDLFRPGTDREPEQPKGGRRR